MKLVLVETPALADALRCLLAHDWRVEACVPHAVLTDLGPDLLPERFLLRLVFALRDADAHYITAPVGTPAWWQCWQLILLARAAAPDEGVSPCFQVSLSETTTAAVDAALSAAQPVQSPFGGDGLAQWVLDRFLKRVR